MPEHPPLTRRTLDKARCMDPSCEHKSHATIFLQATCHPKAGMEVAYDLTRGVLILSCDSCKREIVQIAVASYFGH